MTRDRRGWPRKPWNGPFAMVNLVIVHKVLCELVWVLSRNYGYAKAQCLDVLERLLGIRRSELRVQASGIGRHQGMEIVASRFLRRHDWTHGRRPVRPTCAQLRQEGVIVGGLSVDLMMLRTLSQKALCAPCRRVAGATEHFARVAGKFHFSDRPSCHHAPTKNRAPARSAAPPAALHAPSVCSPWRS